MKGIQSWLILLLIGGLLGCEQRSGDAQLVLDETASAEVSRIRKVLASNEPFAPADFVVLQDLRSRFADAKLLDDTYIKALYKRSDWASLEEHLRLVAPAQLTLEDATQLALAYFRQGKYAELVEHARSLRKTYPQDFGLLKLQAAAHLNLDQGADAAALLDERWDEVLAKRDFDAITLRGRVHQQLGETTQAIEKLQLALTLSPANKTALNALARLYFALGERERASEFSARAEDVQRRATQQSTQRLHLVDVLSTMQQRWQEQKYREVIELATRAVDQVDEKTRAVVYEYIIGSHERLGEMEQAQQARAQLELLKK